MAIPLEALAQKDQAPPEAAPDTAEVTDETDVAIVEGTALNVRAEPTKDSAKLFVVSSGDQVKVLQIGGSWTRIRTSEAQVGWVHSTVTDTVPRKLLPGSKPASKRDNSESAKVSAVKSGGVTVRSGPGKRNSALFNLSGGERVTVLGKQDGWARIKDRKGRVGWAYSQYLVSS